jgi:hypothetical protein
MTAFVIAGALSWIGRWYQPGGQYSAEEVAQQCIDTLMGCCGGRSLLGARPASAASALAIESRRTCPQSFGSIEVFPRA